MRENRLLLNCVKYCKSEGIFHTVVKDSLFVCINEKFIAFRFGAASVKDDKRLVKNGGRVYRPPTLEDFVGTIRKIQGGD
ncbi:hypothetical protein [Anaerocaecibacter muris]|uniref:hypothetical protein n=1 Tax=Anaerocaecibacter muris TaxID=2941513 RepID=UPI00203B516C|nr:hypothetical protein [Anaerocaecibacter muris]